MLRFRERKYYKSIGETVLKKLGRVVFYKTEHSVTLRSLFYLKSSRSLMTEACKFISLNNLPSLSFRELDLALDLFHLRSSSRSSS